MTRRGPSPRAPDRSAKTLSVGESVGSCMALRVGVVRDERYLLHQPGLMHPERPERLTAIYGMLDREFCDVLVTIKPELASLEQLESVHRPAYVRKVLRSAERAFTYLAPDTPVGSQSYLAASLAVGGCIRGLDAVLSGECDVCLAFIRPPGHHALPDRAGGFCVYNNLAVTARYAMRRHGMRRILIVDWDSHHGNGIQEVFYEEKEVFYFSTHFMGWYPGTGDWQETGAGAGSGYTINVPVPRDMGDKDLPALYQGILNPVMAAYQPELILVAAGFDGHHLDPIGRLNLTENAYRTLTRVLLSARSAAGSPPLVFALEGGYYGPALARCVEEVLRVLLADGNGNPLSLSISSTGKGLLEKVRSIHAGFRVWTG